MAKCQFFGCYRRNGLVHSILGKYYVHLASFGCPYFRCSKYHFSGSKDVNHSFGNCMRTHEYIIYIGMKMNVSEKSGFFKLHNQAGKINF